MSRQRRDVRHGGDIDHRCSVRILRTGQTQCRAQGATYDADGINRRRTSTGGEA
ncbi:MULTISPECIES: hypothetical protein [Idiomarina]|uniref:hypothetical protein n=1 Tax=Idiomarina TaxID=135575 RepID=UPI000AD10D1D|nr:hypothetical protein [Idiomarina sp. T82-3]